MNNADERERKEAYIDGVDPSEFHDTDQLRVTPEQHEQLKDGLHGELFENVRRSERRYLVIGRGSGEPGKRRREVCDLLDERWDATAFRLEDFGFTGEDLTLWAPAFDILSEIASHIVGVLEDYDGGHVWELGYLYRYQTTVRDVFWLLKRMYDTEEKMRERYDNGMAASHLASFEEAVRDRVITWKEPSDLPEAVQSVP